MTGIAVLGAGRIGPLHAESLMRAGVGLVFHAPDLRAAHALVDRLGARVADGVRAAMTVGIRHMPRLHRAVAVGELGEVLMLRATAYDKDSPPVDYLAARWTVADCLIQDLDARPGRLGNGSPGVCAHGAVLTSGLGERPPW